MAPKPGVTPGVTEWSAPSWLRAESFMTVPMSRPCARAPPGRSGHDGVTTAVSLEVAFAEPSELVAVTTTCTVNPTSPLATTWVDAVAPEIVKQTGVAALPLVGKGDRRFPLQVPAVAVSVWPSLAVPLIVGIFVFEGGDPGGGAGFAGAGEAGEGTGAARRPGRRRPHVRGDREAQAKPVAGAGQHRAHRARRQRGGHRQGLREASVAPRRHPVPCAEDEERESPAAPKPAPVNRRLPPGTRLAVVARTRPPRLDANSITSLGAARAGEERVDHAHAPGARGDDERSAAATRDGHPRLERAIARRSHRPGRAWAQTHHHAPRGREARSPQDHRRPRSTRRGAERDLPVGEGCSGGEHQQRNARHQRDESDARAHTFNTRAAARP